MDLREVFAANFAPSAARTHERGLSQDDLAYEAEVSRSYLSQIEKGEFYASLKIIGKLAAEIELVATRDGRTAPEAPCFYANWMETGRSVLTMMTGWRVPDDLVDYTARILQVRALLNQSMTSGDLDGLLSMYELAHAAAARGGPWMSSEYAALLPGDARLRAASEGAPPRQINEGGPDGC